MMVILIVSGCLGMSNLRFGSFGKGGGINPEELYPGWAENDRCTKCHMAWTWEHGYYRGWDRHGLISDYSKVSPSGYKDPYGLDVPVNSFKKYYYTPWWQGEWLEAPPNANPSMTFDGYGRVNDGTATPGDFAGKVIVVDQSGAGDSKTVQGGIDKASSGSTVFVKAGTYKESVVLKEGIRLWGENVYTTVIDSENKASVIIAANHCDISGLTLTGTGFDYGNDRFHAAINAVDCDSTLIIRGNLFFSNSVFGIVVESSRKGVDAVDSEQRFIEPENALENLQYKGFPNPRIIGNTFYNIGERAIYCIHAAPEIANNIFIGNLKTLGMTQLSKPFIHHNVFYRNNVSINVNRSMPIIANNIMYKNTWGERIMEGAFPVIRDNVTFESPYYKEFGEDGDYLVYKPSPGTGELTVNPSFAEPDSGDFSFTTASPLNGRRTARSGYGLVSGEGIQQPPVIACAYSWADEFLHRTPETAAIIEKVDSQNRRITSLDAAYEIEYRSFMKARYDSSGNQLDVDIRHEPVSGTSYSVSDFSFTGKVRSKRYSSTLFSGTQSVQDSGTVVFDGKLVRALSGRYKIDYPEGDNLHLVGELPTRENIGGLYLDYDQYLNGSIGPGGTYYFGYLRILGGLVLPDSLKETIDGHECVVVQYPHLGSDQVYKFYLDPALDYRPRRLEQYFDKNLYRRIDNYVYVSSDNIHVPVSVTVTDYAVKEPNIGEVIGIAVMRVNPSKFVLNGKALDLRSVIPAPVDFITMAKNGKWTPPVKVKKHVSSKTTQTTRE
jgi:hypothetical protein